MRSTLPKGLAFGDFECGIILSMSRKLEFSLGEFYHIYNRGVDKRKIFLSQADYRRFLTLLFACNRIQQVNLREQGDKLADAIATAEKSDTLASIGAYCLMPNHFHMILQEKTEGGISRFMQKLQTAYTMYFNERNKRSGSLFQGTFKARHTDDDTYLKYLISYIHLNPVKIIEPTWKETGIQNRVAAENFLENYHHSSYLDYTGKDRQEKTILELGILPEYFKTKMDYKSAVTEWLSYNTLSPKG